MTSRPFGSRVWRRNSHLLGINPAPWLVDLNDMGLIKHEWGERDLSIINCSPFGGRYLGVDSGSGSPWSYDAYRYIHTACLHAWLSWYSWGFILLQLEKERHQWRSHWGCKGAECHPWQRKNCQKSGKKRRNREEKAKIGKVFLLCPSWQTGLAMLLKDTTPFVVRFDIIATST